MDYYFGVNFVLFGLFSLNNHFQYMKFMSDEKLLNK